MPCFEEARLFDTLNHLREHAEARRQHDYRVFLVDDGSDVPVQASVLPVHTEHFSVLVLRHVLNLGQGAALETARRCALTEAGFDAYVTMDSDGQHGIDDVDRLLDGIAEGADIVLGERFSRGSQMPRTRRLVLTAARAFERALTGIDLKDAHNGLRAFSPRAAARWSIAQNRMAHATELRQTVARLVRHEGYQLREVPVLIHYTRDSLRKGQSSLGAVAILTDLLQRLLFGSELP